MAYAQQNNASAAFRPFTPRTPDVGYRSMPAGPKVFLVGSDAGSGVSDILCGPGYPYDPRNLSLREVFHSQTTQFTFQCAGMPPLTITVPASTFYSTISQADADNIACEAAAQKAIAAGYPCASCTTPLPT